MAGPRPIRRPAECAEHRRQLNPRLRATLLAGAERHSMGRNRGGLAEEELREAMLEYPGDLPTEPLVTP
jgi:hypothetical protein